MKIKWSSLGSGKDEKFVGDHANTIFDTPPWLKVLRDRFKRAEVFYVYLEDEGVPLLCLAITILDFRFTKVAYSNFPYGGFMGDRRYIPIFLKYFIEDIKKKNVGILRIIRTYWADFQDLENFNKLEDCHHILDLRGVTKEQLWNGYKRRVRRDIRRALKSCIYIESIKNPNEIEILYTLYKETSERNKTYLHWNKDSLYSIYKNLILQDEGDILFAKKSGHIIAGIIILRFKNTHYYFLSASLSKYLSCCPNDLLIHTAIELAIEKKSIYFDFMTTPRKDRSLINFKEKWGSLSYPLYIYEKKFGFFKANIWKIAYKIVNTQAGSFFLRNFG